MARPRLHPDDAARAAAYRARRDSEASLGFMALTILRKPTTKLIAHLSRIMAETADDKALVAADIAKAMLDGLQAGGGGNCADAARNYVRLEQRVY